MRRSFFVQAICCFMLCLCFNLKDANSEKELTKEEKEEKMEEALGKAAKDNTAYLKQIADRKNGVQQVHISNYNCDELTLGLMIGALVLTRFIMWPAHLVALYAFASAIHCWWSFVRFPAMTYAYYSNPQHADYNNSGKYKEVYTDSNGNVLTRPVTDYVDATKATRSSQITVCFRVPLPIPESAITDEEKQLKDGITVLSDLLFALLIISGPLECKKAQMDDVVNIWTARYKIYQRGRNICAKLTHFLGGMPAWPVTTIGCHEWATVTVMPLCKTSLPIKDSNNNIIDYDNSSCFSCYIGNSCWDATNRHSKALIPLTSVVIQCFAESLDLIVNGYNKPGGRCQKKGMLEVVQERLYKTITVFMTLVIMFFVLKLMMGAESLKKSEFVPWVLKVIFVLYFTTPKGGLHYFYPMIRKMPTELSNLMLSAAGNTSVCKFDKADYLVAQGNNLPVADYSYLALWDRFDCRMWFYLGAPHLKEGSYSSSGDIMFLTIISYLPLAFISGMILLFVFMLFCAILVVLLVLWVGQLFLLSSIALSIVLLVGPIFIPMMMFQYTKPFFDGWLKELIAYMIYPMVITGYVGFIFTVIDEIHFGDLVYTKKDYTTTSGRVAKIFVLPSGSISKYSSYPTDARPKPPIGYAVTTAFKWKELGSTSVGNLVNSIKITGDVVLDLTMDMIICSLLLFLFINFANIVSAIAGELSGGSRSAMELGSHALTPGQLAKKGAQGIKKGIDTVKKLKKGEVGEGGDKGGKPGKGEGGDKSSRGGGSKGGGANVGASSGGKG